MLKIAPLIDLFFKGESWGARAEKIAACGYKYVETWQGKDAAVLKEMNAGGIQLISVVVNFATDAAVAPVNPKSREAFLDQVDKFADNALAAGCHQGIITAGQKVNRLSREAQREALTAALAAAGERVRDRGFNLVLEPLNTEVDHAGYFISDPAEAVSIVKETACSNVKVLYDIYHMSIMRGNQTEFLRHNINWIGHFHVAGVPGRHEPKNGEINYPFLLKEIDTLGYQNWIGLEYMPLLESRESLLQTAEYFKI